MNGRQHLILDALGQAGIILMFSFMIAKSEHPLEVLEILAILLFLWQFANAFISYRYFERMKKALFIQVAGWALIGLSGFLGLLWVALQFSSAPLGFANQSIAVIELLVPYIFGIFALWCLILTLNELYNTVFNRI